MTRLIYSLTARNLRHPALWLLWVGLALWTYVWLQMEPELTLAAVGSLLTLTAWLGTVLAIANLGREGWILGQLSPAARCWTELAVTGCTGFLASAPFLALGAIRMPENLAWLTATGLLLLLIHGAAVVTLLLRIPLARPVRVWLYVLLTWLVPAVWSPEGGWQSALVHVTGWTRLGRVWEPVLGPGDAVVDMAGAAALLLAAWMILSSGSRRRCATES